MLVIYSLYCRWTRLCCRTRGIIRGQFFKWNDSGFSPKVGVAMQKSELQTENQSCSQTDPQNPNHIAQKTCPSSVWALLQKTPPQRLLESIYHLPRKHYPINSENFRSGNGNKKIFDKVRGPGRVMSCSPHRYNRYHILFEKARSGNGNQEIMRVDVLGVGNVFVAHDKLDYLSNCPTS